MVFGSDDEKSKEINPLIIFRKSAEAIIGKATPISLTTEEEVNKRAEEAARQRALDEQMAREEAERINAEEQRRAEEEARQKAMAEQRAREEARRQEAEKAAEEERARQEAEKAAEEERARQEADRIRAEELKRAEEEARQKALAEQRAREEARRQEAEKAAEEERARQEAEKAAEEERARQEAERIRAEELKRAEEEARQKALAEQRAIEEARRLEAEKAAEEERARQEAERIRAEEHKRAEEEARKKALAEQRAIEEARRQEAERKKARVQVAEVKVQQKDDKDDKRPGFLLLHWKKITGIAAIVILAGSIWKMSPSKPKDEPGIVIEKKEKGYALICDGMMIEGTFDSIYFQGDTVVTVKNDSIFIFDKVNKKHDFQGLNTGTYVNVPPKNDDESIKAKADWEKIQKMPREKVTIQMLDTFLKQHPSSQWENEVLKWKKELVDKLKETMNEEGMYQQAVNSESVTFCDLYMSQYPGGKYKKEITDLKARLLKEEEESLWGRAKTEGTTEAYQRYLDKYPTGSHSQEARDERKKLEEKIRKAQETSVKVDEPTKPTQAEVVATPPVKNDPEMPIEKNVPVPPAVAAIEKNMVNIGKGSHTLGCNNKSRGCDPKDGTKSVSLSPFMIGKFEVTQEQYRAVMGRNPSHFDDKVRNPVENLTYNEVMDFIQKLNSTQGNPYRYRLPTEAEWEYAALGGTDMLYSGSNDPGQVAVVDETGTSVVGRKKANAWGLYDMSGNVAEFCSDDYGPYTGGKTNARYKVVKGGSYLDTDDMARIRKRSKAETDRPFTFIGFRLVRELK